MNDKKELSSEDAMGVLSVEEREKFLADSHQKRQKFLEKLQEPYQREEASFNQKAQEELGTLRRQLDQLKPLLKMLMVEGAEEGKSKNPELQKLLAQWKPQWGEEIENKDSGASDQHPQFIQPDLFGYQGPSELEIKVRQLQDELEMQQKIIHEQKQLILSQERELSKKSALGLSLSQEQIREDLLELVYPRWRELFRKKNRLSEEISRLEALLKEKTQLLKKNEKLMKKIEGAYQKAKGRCEEREGEIRKAHQHMAKKLRENALLRDAMARLKSQYEEQHSQLQAKIDELEHFHHQQHFQRFHEEKLQSTIEERIEEKNKTIEEWQQKFKQAQDELQVLKDQREETFRVKQKYNRLLTLMKPLQEHFSVEETSQHEFLPVDERT